jgi:hypothetical protein
MLLAFAYIINVSRPDAYDGDTRGFKMAIAVKVGHSPSINSGQASASPGQAIDSL